MAEVKKPKFTIKTGDLAGEYTLRVPFKQGELEVIWDIAGVGIMEMDEHLARGNPKLVRALLTVALTQSGRVVEPAMFADLDYGKDLSLEWPTTAPETKADGSPLAPTNSFDEPESESENRQPNGETSGVSSAITPENVMALYSGSPGSVPSSASDPETLPA